ncbi:MAG: ATP-dependent Clp protease proteolytic subunit [Nitrospiraceae bacterium]
MPNWGEVLQELQEYKASAADHSKRAVDYIRRKYLHSLHEHTERNVIAYYSGYLSKPDIPSEINDEDKNGFMMAVHKLDRSKGLDLILHTPGGSIAAVQSITDYLHKMFNDDIRAIVPQIAMSAGTMLACSCKRILMSKHSNLGPIDPHLRGIPAYGVIMEFRRAWKEIKKDPSKISIWQPIIGQYRPTFLSQCENAIAWSNQFVQRQLETVMFSSDPYAKKKAKQIVKKLTDYKGNKAHDRHIHADECIAMGLAVDMIEADQKLQDLVLTVHHCYMHSLMNTPSYKMIENHDGLALVKQQAVMVQQ